MEDLTTDAAPAAETAETAAPGEDVAAQATGTLLGQDDDGADGTEKPASEKEKAEDKPKETDPLALVPEKPEGYAITFAEGTQVDTALLDGFKAKAHELGIPQGQAQKLADFYAEQAGKGVEAAQTAQLAALDAAQGEWEAEIKARPGFKQELASAKHTLKEFGGPELAKIMNQTRLGSHPVFFDFMVKVGKALAEPESRSAGAGGGKEKPLMDRLWPDK